MSSSPNFQRVLTGAQELHRMKSQRRALALLFLLPLVFMMAGTWEDDANSSPSRQRAAPSAGIDKLPGNLNGACRGDFGGYCVPVGSCSPEHKIQANQESCDAGLECCTKELNMNLCASKGGECTDIGRCGEGPALFREAEDCNRAKHGKDCCIWM